MARVKGIEPNEAGPVLKLIYWYAKRQLGGKLVEPVKVNAHHGKLFRAWAKMESTQQSASEVDSGLKALVDIKVAMMVGCPF